MVSPPSGCKSSLELESDIQTPPNWEPDPEDKSLLDKLLQMISITLYRKKQMKPYQSLIF
jgi:hypothetical protein